MRRKSRRLSVTRTHPASRHDKARRTSFANAFETRAISKPSFRAISPRRSPDRCHASGDGVIVRFTRAKTRRTFFSSAFRSCGRRIPARSSWATMTLKYSNGAKTRWNSWRASFAPRSRNACMKSCVSRTYFGNERVTARRREMRSRFPALPGCLRSAHAGTRQGREPARLSRLRWLLREPALPRSISTVEACTFGRLAVREWLCASVRVR